MSERKRSHALQGVIGYVLALLLAVSLTSACALTLLSALMKDQALHERVALDERVLEAQSARIETTVREMAQRYSFAPGTVLDVVAREGLSAYNREMISWWMGLLGEHPEMNAPLPDTNALAEVIRTDELFRENTDEFMRRTIARDEVAYPIGVAMRQAVMPLRVSLVSLGLPELIGRVDVPRLVGRIGTAQTALFALSAALLVLVMITQGRRRWQYASAALMAAFVLMAAATVAVAAADLSGVMEEYSSLLSLQLGILLRELTGPVLLVEAAVLITGILLLLPALRRRGRVYRGKHERKRA